MDVDYIRHSSGQMFKSPLIERFSRVHPATPFVFYAPIITWALVYAWLHQITSVAYIALFVPAGWFTWQILEYTIHKGFFHWEGNGPFTRRIHDIAHGYHHKYPDDTQRLVMPLGASIPAAAVIAGVLWLFHAPAVTIPMFFGIMAAYMFYDFTHWSTHARAPKTRWGKAIRSHHMAHHFASPAHNFGISHRWLDVVLGTGQRREP